MGKTERERLGKKSYNKKKNDIAGRKKKKGKERKERKRYRQEKATKKSGKLCFPVG